MNYPESKEILKKVQKAKRILLNCHNSPDPDSVASCISLFQVLKEMGKDTTMICPDGLPEEVKFLKQSSQIQKVDFAKFKFLDFDLFLALDSSAWTQVTGSKNIEIPSTNIISIDHHVGSGVEKFANLNLIDGEVSSTCEILFNLFKDWKISINKELATTLLTGIYGDTGAFQYNTTKISTMHVSGELMELGADMNFVVFNLFRSLDLEVLRFWGDILSKIEVDEKFKFAWSALDYSIISKYSKIKKAKSTAASLFLRVIKDTDFGVIMTESSKGVLSVSFRERYGFDVSRIAAELGGGGHKSAAAAEIKGLPFEEAVEKVLETCRKFARQNV